MKSEFVLIYYFKLKISLSYLMQLSQIEVKIV